MVKDCWVVCDAEGILAISAGTQREAFAASRANFGFPVDGNVSRIEGRLVGATNGSLWRASDAVDCRDSSQ